MTTASDGSLHNKLSYYGDGGEVVVDCDIHARWALGKEFIQLSVAQGCLNKHRKLRLYAAVGAGDGHGGDPSDWTSTVKIPYA